jgi:hypothetical protein
LHKRRFENNLIAKELTSAIVVTEDTILNWEKNRIHLPLEKILLLREKLNIDPSEFIDLDDSFTLYDIPNDRCIKPLRDALTPN